MNSGVCSCGCFVVTETYEIVVAAVVAVVAVVVAVALL